MENLTLHFDVIGKRFDCFFFAPLDFIGTMDALAVHGDVDSFRKVFSYWTRQFGHSSSIFYSSQLYRHQRMVDSAFIEMIGCEEYGEDYLRGGEYEFFIKRCGINEHRHHTAEYKNMMRNDVVPQWTSLYQSMVDEVRFIYGNENFYDEVDQLSEFWFNKIVSGRKGETSTLHRLPYRDYLLTTHWRRVRAAMIMIHGARCQHDDCVQLGEPFWGEWESELNVHHLNYRNMGNERFRDLTLLCNLHHRREHGK